MSAKAFFCSPSIFNENSLDSPLIIPAEMFSSPPVSSERKPDTFLMETYNRATNISTALSAIGNAASIGTSAVSGSIEWTIELIGISSTVMGGWNNTAGVAFNVVATPVSLAGTALTQGNIYVAAYGGFCAGFAAGVEFAHRANLAFVSEANTRKAPPSAPPAPPPDDPSPPAVPPPLIMKTNPNVCRLMLKQAPVFRDLSCRQAAIPSKQLDRFVKFIDCQTALYGAFVFLLKLGGSPN